MEKEKQFDKAAYDQAWRKKAYIRVPLDLSKSKDEDIILILEQQENKSQFIKQCIRMAAYLQKTENDGSDEHI